MIMENEFQSILDDKIKGQIIKLLLTTFKLEMSLSKLADILKTSRPTLQKKIEDLEAKGFVYKYKTNIFLTTDKEILTRLDNMLSINSETKKGKIEKIQRKLVRQYIDNLGDIDKQELIKKFGKRPDDNFDIKEIIHPALSITNNLTISSVSDEFYNLFSEYNKEEDIKNKNILDFFKETKILIYNFETDTITKNKVYTEIYNNLITQGSANLDVYYKSKDGEEKFFTIFMVIQTNYLGIQSIIPDITSKVLKNRERLRLTHRFYHLVSVLKTLSDEFNELEVNSTEYKLLTDKLKRLSSFQYLNTIYASEKSQKTIKIFRDFQLCKNLESIIQQLNFLYNLEENVLTFNQTEEIKLSNVYDIYIYEGLYLLLEELIKKAGKSCKYTIQCNKKSKYEKSHEIEILFNQNINSDIMEFFKKLKREIIKNASINQNHLDIKFFIDKIPKNMLLELVISTYFKDIQINFNGKLVLLELKNKHEIKIE
jgi:DNA-binding Lrp family transcriptional regulator